MMTPMNNLKTAIWWKRILYFLPFLLATIGLAVWYLMKPKSQPTPSTVADSRGAIIDKELESAIDTINDLEQSIHETADIRQSWIRELRELANRRGIKDEIITRAISDNDFASITSLISATFDTTTGQDNPT